MKKRFTEAQIVGFLREADAGIPLKDLCHVAERRRAHADHRNAREVLRKKW